MSAPTIPDPVRWQNGMILLPDHFQRSDDRTAALAHVAALIGDPWPWGFLAFRMDATALAAARLRIDCAGVFPDGEPFRQNALAADLPAAQEGDQLNFHVYRGSEQGQILLGEGDDAPSDISLPAARLLYHSDVWSATADWSPPSLIVDEGHPIRDDANRQLGALAALAAGFMATLRLPGADARPVARTIGRVAAAIVEGVGVMEALLAAPAVSPGRLGIEALRLALAVRGAVGTFETFQERMWDAADQRGSLRRLLYSAEAAASGIGLPFRATVFQEVEGANMLVADNVPTEAVVLAVEATQAADLMAARNWLAGAALASPDRIQEALTRRVEGSRRYPVDRDAHLGVSSGPLLALYRVDPDLAWRATGGQLALAAKSPPPNASFSVLIAEGVGMVSGASGPLPTGDGRGLRSAATDWSRTRA